MKIWDKCKVWLVGQNQGTDKLGQFCQEKGFVPQNDSSSTLCEVAGRLCYMSFTGRRRKDQREYLENIINSGHGSVLEHATFSFVLEGVSRSFTHELVRHRVFSYSQLSQRYVDSVDFVLPPALRGRDTSRFEAECEYCLERYEGWKEVYREIYSDRKLIAQAARAMLPNCTETKIFVTANARGLRNFFELRCNPAADLEMQDVAREVLKRCKEVSCLFDDVTENGESSYRKV